MTKAQILQIIASNIPDNNEGEITEFKIRETLKSLITYLETFVDQSAEDFQIVSHNELTTLQGGTPTERFHLSELLFNAISAANNPSAENHVATIADTAAGQTAFTWGDHREAIESLEAIVANLDHNTLTNLQGGTPTERFHITRPQAEAIEAANNPTEENPFATMGDISEKITITEVKEITGYRIDLNTQGKDDLVQAINESNTWTVIEW